MTQQEFDRIIILLSKGILLEQGISDGTIIVTEEAKNTLPKEAPPELVHLNRVLSSIVVPEIDRDKMREVRLILQKFGALSATQKYRELFGVSAEDALKAIADDCIYNP